MGQAAHLIRRFAGSLAPGGPAPADEEWVASVLGRGELELWRRMSAPDRRHAVGVARRVEDALGDRADRPVLAAALLHDVGKVESGLGTGARVVATVAGMVLGRRRAASWRGRPGPAGRLGTYLDHPDIGAELLRRTGADPLTSAWAGCHHLPPDRWTVDPEVGKALKEADDD
ncbi:MAG TPA: HD domain-containing protein [Acidimicrobiales bacterium]|nr:HD domain-containing protein [Acidimicrobiales bacterium]